MPNLIQGIQGRRTGAGIGGVLVSYADRLPLVSAAVAGRAAPTGESCCWRWGQPLLRPAASFTETGTSNRPSVP
jgi:hypothetical protein